jgi:hypothetical protein
MAFRYTSKLAYWPRKLQPTTPVTLMRAILPLRRRVSLRLSSVLVACALTAAVVTTSDLASAQEIEVEIEVVPPAPRVEVIPAPPSVHHFWIHGYYGWNGATHYWIPGRYEVIRPGWGWSEARWAPVGRRWHFYPGHWYH